MKKMYPKSPKVEATAGVEVVRAENKLQVAIGEDADGKKVTITLAWKV